MKRVLCGALAVILAIGCLTGCQEGNDLNSTNESSQAVSSKPNPADMESENTEESSMAYQKTWSELVTTYLPDAIVDEGESAVMVKASVGDMKPDDFIDKCSVIFLELGDDSIKDGFLLQIDVDGKGGITGQKLTGCNIMNCQTSNLLTDPELSACYSETFKLIDKEWNDEMDQKETELEAEMEKLQKEIDSILNN